ncbi:ribosomal protein [Cyclospora cayetanensis]|uniref:Ribosomal protein n=1 Tax=Cyclospora cayetanensis TaxID=88456 RepID=A0A1D3CUK5_9EIME|nr:ribosomal protein [Cyclospora cayetanensis]
MKRPSKAPPRRGLSRFLYCELLCLVCGCFITENTAAHLLIFESEFLPSLRPSYRLPPRSAFLSAPLLPASFGPNSRHFPGPPSSMQLRTSGSESFEPRRLSAAIQNPMTHPLFAFPRKGEEENSAMEGLANGESFLRIGGGLEGPHGNPKEALSRAKQRDFSWGTRKQSYARVRLLSGSGRLTVNGRDGGEYFQGNEFWLLNCRAPLVEVNSENRFDIEAQAKGGGLGGQSGAIMLAVAQFPPLPEMLPHSHAHALQSSRHSGRGPARIRVAAPSN